MHRHVPSSPKGIDVVCVPPVAVKIPIREMQQFAHQVEKGVKRQVEETKPHQMIRYLEHNKDFLFIYAYVLNSLSLSLLHNNIA